MQIVINRHPLVEDEALALPERVFGIHFFEVVENAAFQVIDLLETQGLEVSGRLFTTDTAGTEHGDFLIAVFVQVARDILGKFAKAALLVTFRSMFMEKASQNETVLEEASQDGGITHRI